jgi:hypothetical protein
VYAGPRERQGGQNGLLGEHHLQFGNEAAKEQFMKDAEANLAKAQKYYEEHKG